MVIDDFNSALLFAFPVEAKAILVVDPDTMLPRPIRLEGLQMIARWQPQIRPFARAIQLCEFAEYAPFELCGSTVVPAALPQPRRLATGEARNHPTTLSSRDVVSIPTSWVLRPATFSGGLARQLSPCRQIPLPHCCLLRRCLGRRGSGVPHTLIGR